MSFYEAGCYFQYIWGVPKYTTTIWYLWLKIMLRKMFSALFRCKEFDPGGFSALDTLPFSPISAGYEHLICISGPPKGERGEGTVRQDVRDRTTTRIFDKDLRLISFFYQMAVKNQFSWSKMVNSGLRINIKWSNNRLKLKPLQLCKSNIVQTINISRGEEANLGTFLLFTKY